MLLKELVLSNFGPYKGENKIKFATDRKKNITLVFAKNTYGKTSIIRALRWVLYGSIYHKNKKKFSYIEILNKTSKNSGNCDVKVELIFSEQNKDYRLARSFSSKKEFPQNDEDFESDINLIIDNVVQTGGVIQIKINSILPEPVSRFSLFDGELLDEYQQLVIEDSVSVTKIKESIEQILGIPTIINGRDDLGTIKNEVNKEKNAELKRKGQHTKDLEVIEELSEKILNSQNEKNTLLSQKNNISEKVEAIENEIRDLDQKVEIAVTVDRILNSIKTLNQRKEKLEKERFSAAALAWKTILKKNITKFKKNTNIKSKDDILIEIGKLSSKIEIFEKLIETNNCQTCGDIKEDDLVSLKIELKNKKTELSNQNSPIDLFSLLETNDISVLKIDDEIGIIDVEIIKEENELEGYRTSKGTAEDRKFYKQQVEKKTNYNAQIKKIESQISDVEKKIRSYDQQKTELQQRINQRPGGESSELDKKIEIYTLLHETFDATIDSLREKMKKVVEKNATDAFINLKHRDSYEKLQINANYGLTIIDKSGNSVDISSSGAQQVVALSLIDSLSKTGKSNRPVVMDTPFGRLDIEHRENILKYLPKSSSQLVLLAHKGEINDDLLTHVVPMIGKEYEINLTEDGISSYIGHSDGRR